MTIQKKYHLTPTRYDEVSLVDNGAAEDAMVLIMKRDVSKASSQKPPAKNQKKGGDTQRAQNWNEGRHARTPTGVGGGEFSTTSSESKKKYGKGGTTKANEGDSAKASLMADMQTHVTAARARIKAEGGDNKKSGGGGAAKKGAAAKTSAAKTAANKKIAAQKKVVADKKRAAAKVLADKKRILAAAKSANSKITSSTNKAAAAKKSALALALRVNNYNVSHDASAATSTAKTKLHMDANGKITTVAKKFLNKTEELSKWLERKTT